MTQPRAASVGDFSGTSIYPSCVVHLRIRLDTSIQYKVPQTRSVADLASPQPGTLAPLFQEQGDGFSRLNGIVPLTCTVELSSYRKGGKYNFKLPFRDFPIDTRLIKAGSAKIYAGTVSATDFANGMLQALPKTQSDQFYFQRSSLIQATDDNLLISGPLDPPKMHVSSEGLELEFTGRDNVATLADAPIDPAVMAALDITKSIDSVVVQILALHPLVKDRKIDPFTVVANASDWKNGVIPSPGTTDGITRVRKKASGQGAQMHPGADPTSSISFWDLIVQYCQLVSAVPWFQPDGSLLIRPAVSLHDWQWAEQNYDPNVKTPFAGNIPRTLTTAQGATEITYRRMVIGRNIEELTFDRKTSGVKARVVQVVSIDDDAEGRGSKQKLLIAEFPKNARGANGKVTKAAVSSVTPDGDKASTDVLRVSVFGIRSKDQLEQIAEGIFNEVMHQEIGGTCQTKDLFSLGGNNGDPDLLKLRVGEPVQILVDSTAFDSNAPHVSQLLANERMSFAEAVAALKPKTGNDENFARAVVATARNLVPGLQNTFRTSSVKFDFTLTGDSPSVSINFDFQNYIDAQYDGVNRAPSGATSQPTKSTP